MSPDLQQLSAFCQAVREDLLLLALLHDRELDRELIQGLWQECQGDFLGFQLKSASSRQALRCFHQGLRDIPKPLEPSTLDILAAEFADIYLNYSFHIAPCESVWTDEDGLTHQESMFQVRRWYERYGLQVADWRKRADDHLVTQLQFIAHLLESEPSPQQFEAIARFLDEHLLRWIELFSNLLSERCRTRFYGGLALLTSAYLVEFRDFLAERFHLPRPTQEEIDQRMRGKEKTEESVPFVPGIASLTAPGIDLRGSDH